ncbi:YopX family protein [Fusobacterium massiliense]|uniref:YopX family protein n=1 Tax=Fusobacterium massiliense TaxID=1852365 RepID=UPI0009F48D24|nr:YopX family protein [Fusobacterium massiliense]
MSKEIKFRAWLKNKKEMVDVALINYVTKCITYALTKKGSMLTIIDENFSNIELLQYIGLKDKNNKEIYEGDIVKIDRQLFRVSYMEEKASYMLDEVDSYMSDYLSNYDINKLEKVGNIYENVELLGENE